MSFFDDKQEILKLELTTYGRYLISRGKFKPVYYAFFDDDVLYDGQYASLSESQNDIQTRLLNESIALKPQSTFTSLENSIKLNNLLFTDPDLPKQEEQQIASDKNYALSSPLGNSSLNSDYLPAWSLQFLNGKIDSAQSFLSGAGNSYQLLRSYLNYPQINLQDNVYDIKLNKNDLTLLDNYNLVYTVTDGTDKYFYSVKDDPILLSLKENNVDELLKNFDIEVFIEEEEPIVGSNEKKKVLRQLNFKKESQEIIDNILLDEPKIYNTEEDPNFVEYYFDISADDEIETPIGQLPTEDRAAIDYTDTKNKPPFGVDC